MRLRKYVHITGSATQTQTLSIRKERRFASFFRSMSLSLGCGWWVACCHTGDGDGDCDGGPSCDGHARDSRGQQTQPGTVKRRAEAAKFCLEGRCTAKKM
jgi:hypothetical protein